MVISDRKSLEPACLPPTARAFHFHGLRTYHQIKVWRKLSDKDQDPTTWGWKIENQKLIPIIIDKAPAPGC